MRSREFVGLFMMVGVSLCVELGDTNCVVCSYSEAARNHRVPVNVFDSLVI